MTDPATAADPEVQVAPAHQRGAYGVLTAWAALALGVLLGLSRLSYGLLLPALRADFRMSEEFSPARHARLPVPLLALTGRDDPEVRPSEAAGWAQCTDAGFSVVVLRGGHFFLHSRRDDVLAEVSRALDAVPAPAAAP